MVAVKREQAQEDPKTMQNNPLGAALRPQGVYFAEFGFLLGPASFWRLPFFTTFLAYALRRRKIIILQFFRIWAF